VMEAPNRNVLNQLFCTPLFQETLSGAVFPGRALIATTEWNQFLKRSADQSLSGRCLLYLALVYQVSPYTIEAAVNGKRGRQDEPRSRQPAEE